MLPSSCTMPFLVMLVLNKAFIYPLCVCKSTIPAAAPNSGKTVWSAQILAGNERRKEFSHVNKIGESRMFNFTA